VAFGRLERNPGSQPMADINMTPLIDVMMVLLVIFMITAPLMTASLQLDLPKTTGTKASEAPHFIALAIAADGRFFLADQPLAREQLVARIRDAAHGDAQTEVQLRADQRVPYGRVAELVGLIQDAGLSRIGFVAEAVAKP
jgi:biopolymer transport protein ExbD/biopolymer transport protein TolR